jgi:hypothetical protein
MPRDPNKLAARIVELATREKPVKKRVTNTRPKSSNGV